MSSRMHTAVAMIVLLLAVAAALWLRGGADAPLAPAQASRGESREAPDAIAHETTSSPPPATSTRDAIESPSAAAGFVFRIRVVRDEDGAPVEGAELCAAPSATAALSLPHELRRRSDEDLADHAFRSGRASRSSADGTTVIVHDERSAWIFARSGDRYAGERLRIANEERSGEFELTLMRDETLVFRTIDDSGAVVSGVGLLSSSVFSPTPTEFGSTDPSGLLTMRHAQRFRRRHASVTSFDVCAKVLGGPTSPVAVPLDPLPTDPIAIRVPPRAVLEVVALDSGGAPWPMSASDHLFVTASTKAPSIANHAVAAFDEHGVARFEHVGLGVELEVHCEDLADARLATITPMVAGEVKRIELRVDPGTVVLTGRLLLPDGESPGRECMLAYRNDDTGVT